MLPGLCRLQESKCGYTRRRTGGEAMERALEVRPDPTITDLSMPEMSGDELVARVTADPAHGGTPVLVSSSDRSAARPDELMHAGAVGYMTRLSRPKC